MVFSLEHDIKVTKNHQNLLPTQTSVIVAHMVVLPQRTFICAKFNNLLLSTASCTFFFQTKYQESIIEQVLTVNIQNTIKGY
jgi:hypothetical protein